MYVLVLCVCNKIIPASPILMTDYLLVCPCLCPRENEGGTIDADKEVDHRKYTEAKHKLDEVEKKVQQHGFNFLGYILCYRFKQFFCLPPLVFFFMIIIHYQEISIRRPISLLHLIQS